MITFPPLPNLCHARNTIHVNAGMTGKHGTSAEKHRKSLVRNYISHAHACMHITYYQIKCFAGSKLQAWTLYFSLLVLKGQLPLAYIHHWSLLIGSLQEKGMMNIHLLSHLSQCVRNWDLSGAIAAFLLK